MFIAEEGHKLLFLDKAQLELRIVAWLAQDAKLIEAFLAGLDVHRVNTAAILGLAGPEAVNDKQRKFGKTFTYAVQYGAGVRRVWQMVRNFRDKDGSRPYKDFAYQAADAAYRRWWNERSAIKKYFENGVRLWRVQGYLEEPLHGRRRHFLDGEEEEKEAMSNYRIQSGAAADVNDAQERVFKAYPWGFAGPNTGIVHQNYDSLGIEVPTGTEVEIGRHVKQLMHSMIGDMPLPVDAQAGDNWFELEEIG
jgi:DNA polymerase-1